MVFISNHFTNKQSSIIINPPPPPDPPADESKSYQFITITNYNSHTSSTKTIIDEVVAKWESVIISTPNNIFIEITINFAQLGSGILGGATLSNYYHISSQTIESYTNPTNPSQINPNLYSNYYLGQVIPKSGSIELNSSIWDSYTSIVRVDGKNNAYYILLHEIGHILGIGPLWYLQNTRGVDSNTNTIFYMGSKAINKYNNSLLFTNPQNPITLSFIPIEDDGGDGTVGFHPEEGHELGVSSDDRTLSGVFYPGLNREIMTGWIENDTGTLPLSSITVGFLYDLGYTVNFNNADLYIIPYDNGMPDNGGGDPIKDPQR
jgi:hypothetical protein